MDKVIDGLAAKLKELEAIKPPEWLLFVKSGSHNERPPDDQGFWFKRSASILRVLSEQKAGVRRLRHKYGGRRQHWVRRSHHRPAGGKIIRLAMQQLEKAGLLKKEKVGRVVTYAGKALLDSVLKDAAA